MSVPQETLPLARERTPENAPRPGVESRILLVGNPNVGKSVLFGFLTGKYAIVSNYPGTTVEVARGVGMFHERRAEVVDTPGVNSLFPSSNDERVTRDILLDVFGPGGRRDSSVIQVADAKNLSRALFLTLELAEFQIPFVLALNMVDECFSRGIEVDVEGLREALGVPVVPTVAVQKKGLSQLSASVSGARVPRFEVKYPLAVEEAAREVEAALPVEIRSRGTALTALAGDVPLKENYFPEETRKIIEEIKGRLARRYDEPLISILHRARMRTVQALAARVSRHVAEAAPYGFAAKAGRFAMHPLYGYGVLAGVLYAMWWFVGVFGAGTLVDFVENTIFGKYINPSAIWLFDRIAPIPIVRDFFVGEYGLITMGLTYSVAIILPIVATFFLAFGLLEDSGYLARLAMMMNRSFKSMGLNGRAVLPMVLGIGCDTMATMTTRILETRKERVITILLLVLAVPCSAQLGVIMAMMSVLPASALLAWLGIILSVLVSVGWLAAKILPGRTSDFVLEVPPIRMPRLHNIAVKTFGRIEWYLKEAVPLFLIGTTLVFVFDTLHWLTALRKAGSPIVQGFLGLPAEATDAFVMGFLRRDFGAAGLYALLDKGMLAPGQALVAIVVITLFIPCAANFLMTIKELGVRTGTLIALFVFPFAVLVGGAVHFALDATGWLR